MSDYHKQKLEAEQAAGRRAIQAAVDAEALEKGLSELKRRFRGLTAGASIERTPDGPVVCMRVVTSDKYIDISEPFNGFPSDMLIAQIALVV
ncbi:hypothetical protein [Bradyrhizobium cenepequi]